MATAGSGNWPRPLAGPPPAPPWTWDVGSGGEFQAWMPQARTQRDRPALDHTQQERRLRRNSGNSQGEGRKKSRRGRRVDFSSFFFSDQKTQLLSPYLGFPALGWRPHWGSASQSWRQPTGFPHPGPSSPGPQPGMHGASIQGKSEAGPATQGTSFKPQGKSTGLGLKPVTSRAPAGPTARAGGAPHG